MNQSAHDTTKKVRVTVDMDTELKKMVLEMADKRNWSLAYMSYILLWQAVNEKNRKKSSSNPQQTEKNRVR